MQSTHSSEPTRHCQFNHLVAVDLVAVVLIYLGTEILTAVQGQRPVAYASVGAVVDDKPAIGVAGRAVVSLVAGVCVDIGTTVAFSLVSCVVVLLEGAAVASTTRAARKTIVLAPVRRSGHGNGREDDEKLHFVCVLGRL